jgi:hypothetical protein
MQVAFDGVCALRYNKPPALETSPWRNCMDLGMRRLLLVVLSIIGGIASVFVMFGLTNIVLPLMGISAFVNYERYGMTYFILTAVPMALLVGIWLDYFMRTGILPEDDGPAKKERPGRQAAPAAEE